MVVVNAMGFEPKPDPLYTHTQPCKVFRVTRFTVLPSTPRNLCNTLAGILHSLHHIETHSGIRTLRPASGLQTYPLAIGNGVRFNMVVINALGFEPNPDPLSLTY